MNSNFREINLEEGKPIVDIAIRRLTGEIQNSRQMGIVVLKVIHGYGSSGTGGKIRIAVRRYLEGLKRSGQIRQYIPGETFTIFDAGTREALTLCDALRRDRDLERHNNGITVIVLS
ncbi:MAG: Smr/MutS family protein [Oscillospiraceae bacterium]|mgnify:CR=1 FL=1|nr:Smr/MutS family protein [Oscillospiraceae bacterium]